MNKVLIISPHFPPTNAADMQRVRLVLPYLRENGWQAEVLAVAADCVASPVDEWLCAGLPAEVPVHRVAAMGLGWSRIPGLGTLTFRALSALRRQGDALLTTGTFDLVYFSTTQFGVHVLGPRWQRKFGVPFMMDYQDPWVSDYYRTHPGITPPGGRLKYWVADRLNRWQEPQVLRHCAGITSVSPDYPKQLRERYEWLKIENWESGKQKIEIDRQTRHLTPALSPNDAEREKKAESWKHSLLAITLPFPGDERDLARVRDGNIRQNIFTPGDGNRHWVCVGRGGADMQTALRGIFGAIQKHGRHAPDFLNNLRLHFIGTSYAGAGRGKKTVEPLAEEFALGGVVREHTDRIRYAQALRCLLDADALFVPGSDDPGYTASKIYPYLLARKPLLAVFHENSSVVELMQNVQGGVVTPFRSGESPESIAERIHKSWFETGRFDMITKLDERAFEPHTAPAQARQLAAFFNQTLVDQKLKF